MSKHPTRREREKTAAFVMIKRWELRCPAFQALSGDEVKIYLVMRSRYNGKNNGSICFSSREAGVVINKSHNTGARALNRLTELGFIKKMQDSTFNQKRLCREYQLTAIDLEPAVKSDRLPDGTKDFMPWTKKSIAALDARKAKLKKKKPSVVGGLNSFIGENKSEKSIH